MCRSCVGWGALEKKRPTQAGGGWRRPTLPGDCSPSTIGAGGLNDRVREGTGWTPTAIGTNHPLPASDRGGAYARALPERLLLRTRVRISPRPLVRLGSTHCCASTGRLSSWSSSSGLTWLPSEEAHLEASFPLRCFQRLSAPQVATRHCGWRHNRHTSAASTPVLSY